MPEIHFISTSIIQPANSCSGSTDHRIELTPWDLRLLLLCPIQRGLVFPKPTPLQEKNLLGNTVIDHLKTSLSRTLDFFPPLAGRLTTVEHDDNTSAFFIDCNNAGAHFIHAVAENITITDIIKPMYVPEILPSFFPLNGTQNYEGLSKPLLALQVTELVDGLFIACTFNHVVGDGSSFWHFLNSWSEISRGSDNISRLPVLKRWFPSDISCPITFPFNLYITKLDDKFIPPALHTSVFHFTKEKIAGLKAKANTEMGISRISSLQAICAHLWRSVVRCQGLGTEQETSFKLMIGARPRLRDSLPENYFGNAVHSAVITTKRDELLEKGLGWTAWQINKTIAMQTSDGIRNFPKCWVEKPKLLTRNVWASSDLRMNSSPLFNVYGNDFGWGKPVAVRSGLANRYDGGISVFPGAEDGSVDIELCLSPEKLQAVWKDEEFMEAITV